MGVQKRLYQHVQYGQQKPLETQFCMQAHTCLEMLVAAVGSQLDMVLEGIDTVWVFLS